MADLTYETHTFSPPPVAWRLGSNRTMQLVHVLSVSTDGSYLVHDGTNVLTVLSHEIVWAIEQGEQRGYRIPHAPLPPTEGLHTSRGVAVTGVRRIRMWNGRVEVSLDGFIWDPIDDDDTIVHLDGKP